MPIEVGDIIRVNANFLMSGSEDYTNVFHYNVTGVGVLGDEDYMDAVALELDTAYGLINQDFSVSLDYVDVSGQNVTKNELLPTVLWPTLVSGLDAAPSLPLQIAACVFWRTLRPKTRASKFLPGFTEASNSFDGGIVGAAVIRLQQFGDDILAGVSQGFDTANFGAYNQPLDRFTQAVSAVVPVVFRTQRRRRLGVGE